MIIIIIVIGVKDHVVIRDTGEEGYWKNKHHVHYKIWI